MLTILFYFRSHIMCQRMVWDFCTIPKTKLKQVISLYSSSAHELQSTSFLLLGLSFMIELNFVYFYFDENVQCTTQSPFAFPPYFFTIVTRPLSRTDNVCSKYIQLCKMFSLRERKREREKEGEREREGERFRMPMNKYRSPFFFSFKFHLRFFLPLLLPFQLQIG